MKNKIKLSLITTALLIGSLSFPAVSFADNQEPILIEISDTDIGTEAFEQLISYGNGGHAAMGAILGDAQSMLSNPGIGFSIGSGGNGYRPTILIAVWTDQPFSVSAGLDTIKSHFNVPSNPVTTNGDCAIACDGTHEEPVAVQQPAAAAAAAVPEQTSPDVVEDQPSAPMSTPQVEVSTPQVLSDNTQQYTNPTVVVETNSAFSLSSLAPYVIIADSAKPIVNKTKIAPKIKKTKIAPKIKKTKIAPKIIKSKKIKLVLTKAKQPIK
jgi:hypothetical protein